MALAATDVFMPFEFAQVGCGKPLPSTPLSQTSTAPSTPLCLSLPDPGRKLLRQESGTDDAEAEEDQDLNSKIGVEKQTLQAEREEEKAVLEGQVQSLQAEIARLQDPGMVPVMMRQEWAYDDDGTPWIKIVAAGPQTPDQQAAAQQAREARCDEVLAELEEVKALLEEKFGYAVDSEVPADKEPDEVTPDDRPSRGKFGAAWDADDSEDEDDKPFPITSYRPGQGKFGSACDADDSGDEAITQTGSPSSPSRGEHENMKEVPWQQVLDDRFSRMQSELDDCKARFKQKYGYDMETTDSEDEEHGVLHERLKQRT